MNGYQLFAIFWVFFWGQASLKGQTDSTEPNILIIIADDMGTDVTNGYEVSPT